MMIHDAVLRHNENLPTRATQNQLDTDMTGISDSCPDMNNDGS